MHRHTSGDAAIVITSSTTTTTLLLVVLTHCTGVGIVVDVHRVCPRVELESGRVLVYRPMKRHA